MEAGPAGYPQVFVVDSQAPVTLQPRGVKRKYANSRTYILYLLVGLALLGVVIEAGFIYHLYEPAAQASDNHQNSGPQKLTFPGSGYWGNAGSNEIPPVLKKKPEEEKPAAFMQGKQNNVRGDGVMQWQSSGFGSFIHGLDYQDGSLRIQREGFYYVHSKVYFSESCTLFRHQVKWRSALYNNNPTDLMQGQRYSCVEGRKMGQVSADVGNSFLGGVFKLYKNDSVYVQVNDSRLIRAGVYDNFFGVFMI